MRINYGMRNRQRGVVAVIMGIAAIALFAFMGIGVDLAYTYSRKTELQNAADAASLSGAKELNEKAAGVTAAIAKAIATFNQNNTNNLVGSTFVITPRLVKPLPADYRLPSDNYVEPTRLELFLGGKMEGDPAFPLRPVPPPNPSAPAGPGGFEVK